MNKTCWKRQRLDRRGRFAVCKAVFAVLVLAGCAPEKPKETAPAPTEAIKMPESTSFAGMSREEAGQAFNHLREPPDFSQVDVVAVPAAERPATDESSD